MGDHRTRVVGRLRWLRLATGERLTTCARYWLVPHGRARVWWLYMREHAAGDLRRTSWRLVYRSHKMAAAMTAAAVCQRGAIRLSDPGTPRVAPGDTLERKVAELVRRRVDAELVRALDEHELQHETFVDAVAPVMALWGAR